MISAPPFLEQVSRSKCCSGCGLCAAMSSDSLQMKMAADGFLRPVQIAPIAPEEDKNIADVCPGISLKQNCQEIIDHPLWGPIVSVRTGASTDPALRHHASSGGVLSAILLHLLDEGVVDYVLQTAASSTAPLENMTILSSSSNDIYGAAGSRYAPSAPLENIVAHLDRPGRFALVAKPCDIAAMRAFGRRSPVVAEKIPVMLSFFCAGIPSIDGANTILEELGVAKDQMTRFRYRGDGWPGRATATLRSGEERSMSYSDSWGNILSRHVQFRCKICPDGSGGFADIVCADAWHSDDSGYPLFEEEDGRSLLISRSARGEEYVRSAIEAGYLLTQPARAEHIEQMQPSQAQRKRLVLSRLLAMTLLGRRAPRFRGLNLAKMAMSAGPWSNIRSFIGTLRRLLFRLP